MSSTDDKYGSVDSPGGALPRSGDGAFVASRGSVSDTTTRGIRIQVKGTYQPEYSVPQEGHYFFTYQVRISNGGPDTAQLVSREWIITDLDGEVRRVQGPGVVGEQPVLKPGEFFEYSSSCPLKTSVGSMHGSYQMLTGTGERFDAVIAAFTLAVPNAVN